MPRLWQHRPANARSSLSCEASLWSKGPKSPVPARTEATRKASSTTLAPPSAPTSKPKEESKAQSTPAFPLPTSLPSQVSEFAAQLVNSWQVSWPSFYPQTEAPVAPSQTQVTEQRAIQDISSCIQTTVGVWEMKHIRKLAHLTALTYKMATVTPRALRRKHGLELVTTSWACEIRLYEHPQTAEEILDEGDGMGVSVLDARATYSSLTGRGRQLDPVGGSTQLVPATPQTGVASNIQLIPPQLGLMAQPTASSNPTQSTSTSAGTTASVHSGSKAESGANGASSSNGSSAQAGQSKRWSSPADMVAGMVSDAAAAASAAAASAVATTPLASAATSLYAGLASLPIASALGAGPRSAAPANAAAIMSAAAAIVASNGGGSAGDAQRVMQAQFAAAAGPAAIAAAPATTARLMAPTQSTTGSPACPSEWFVCDDTATNTRYFVIQGSDTIDHWKLNLTFDPVSFEDPSLGVKVHRGAYEAAQILYERFLPMVYEHLDSSPFAKICFTGHSIGGSLGTLLAMMFHYRGVIPAASLANVYTFGAPAIFCVEPDAPDSAGGRARPHGHHHQHHGHHTHWHQAANGTQAGHNGHSKTDSSSSTALANTAANGTTGSSSAPVKPCCCGRDSVTPLTAVGLAEHMVRNVIMTRDIVPRAFACDYAAVSEILKGWGPSFKAHAGLSHGKHKHLYFFTGRMMVLQPDTWHWFVSSEPYHPMLPPRPDLYLVTSADETTTKAITATITTTTVNHATNGTHAATTKTGTETKSSTQGPAAAAGPAANGKAVVAATAAAVGAHGSGKDTAAPPAAAKMAAAAAAAATVKAAAPTTAAPKAPAPSQTKPTNASAAVAVAASKSSGRGSPPAPLVVAKKPAAPPRVRVHNANEALWALMDNPHPLDTLADPGAYLEKGSISRYHNPDNYCAALGRLIFLKRVSEGRIPRWINNSYSRSLYMEAMQSDSDTGSDDYQDLAPWDSSDGDTLLSHVLLTRLDEEAQADKHHADV